MNDGDKLKEVVGEYRKRTKEIEEILNKAADQQRRIREEHTGEPGRTA